MTMRREMGAQGDLVVTWAEMPRSPSHAFYDRLQALLKEAGFDTFVEDICKPYYAPRMGAPSLPPGGYFRMHMVGYFEGIDSERGIVWRCSDSYSLRDFLRLSNQDKVPDGSVMCGRIWTPARLQRMALGRIAELQLLSYIRLLRAARNRCATSHNGFSLAFSLSAP